LRLLTTSQAPMPPGPPGGAADRELTENEQAIANVAERLAA
jgi:hypothetical protein